MLQVLGKPSLRCALTSKLSAAMPSAPATQLSLRLCSERDWDAMKAQFQNNPQAMAIINDIEKNPNFTVMLSENNLGQTQFSGTYEDGKLTSDRIDFDPHTAISYDDQGQQITRPHSGLLSTPVD